MGQINKNAVAECVGLWLAEGDSKTKNEITFTNNCYELVELFSNTIRKVFNNHKFNTRVYVYSKDGSRINFPLIGCKFKYYKHSRATKPYLIFRIASVQMIKEWKNIIEINLKKRELYVDILRGFFAGEGNIHTGKRSVRIIRISQSYQKEFIDRILNELGIKFTFYTGNRNYVISGKSNWDIFAKLKIADLHPQKKEKFWQTYSNFKEDHYKKNFLLNKIPSLLDNPFTSKQLAKKLNRSPARISEVLVKLKKEGKVKNFRIRSVDYWTNNKDLTIISQTKRNYLSIIKDKKRTSELAKYFNVDWKSAFRRLTELQKLNLVEREGNGEWKKKPVRKKIITI